MASNIRSAQVDPLLGPKLKIERAKRHTSDLESAFGSFFESNPYELVCEQDPQSGDYVYRVRIHRCIPDEFSVIVGDIVHNLRSALDQMVCGLVRANRQQVTGGNGFPIMGSQKRFEEALIGKLKNTSAKTNSFIRRLKPYQGGNRTLWLLSELDNMDKHNQIVPVAVGQVQVQQRFAMPMFHITADGGLAVGSAPKGSQPFGFHFGWGTPSDAKIFPVLYDNCEVYRMRQEFANFDTDTQVSIRITFGKTLVTTNEPILETLYQLIKFVDRTINIVERRLL